MCSFLQATHQTCGHTHQSYARCFWARENNAPRCHMAYIPLWKYTENFRCPDCRDDLRAETKAEVRKWNSA